MFVDAFVDIGSLLAFPVAKTSLRSKFNHFTPHIAKLASGCSKIKQLLRFAATFDEGAMLLLSVCDWTCLVAVFTLAFRLYLPLPSCPEFEYAWERREIGFQHFLGKAALATGGTTASLTAANGAVLAVLGDKLSSRVQVLESPDASTPRDPQEHTQDAATRNMDRLQGSVPSAAYLRQAHLHGTAVEHGGGDVHIEIRIRERHQERRLCGRWFEPHLHLGLGSRHISEHIGRVQLDSPEWMAIGRQSALPFSAISWHCTDIALQTRIWGLGVHNGLAKRPRRTFWDMSRFTGESAWKVLASPVALNRQGPQSVQSVPKSHSTCTVHPKRVLDCRCLRLSFHRHSWSMRRCPTNLLIRQHAQHTCG